jgi:hypothetical protein
LWRGERFLLLPEVDAEAIAHNVTLEDNRVHSHQQGNGVTKQVLLNVGRSGTSGRGIPTHEAGVQSARETNETDFIGLSF